MASQGDLLHADYCNFVNFYFLRVFFRAEL
jgi:hypothetical protein